MNNLTKDLKREAVEMITKGFIRIPRAITNGMYDRDLHTRQLNTIFHALLVMSSHSGQIVEFKGDKLFCAKGELYINLSEIALLTGIKKWTVKRILDKLITDDFIRTYPRKKGLLIRVIHYSEFTSARKNGKSQASSPVILTVDGKTPERIAYEEAILEKRRQQMKDY